MRTISRSRGTKRHERDRRRGPRRGQGNPHRPPCQAQRLDPVDVRRPDDGLGRGRRRRRPRHLAAGQCRMLHRGERYRRFCRCAARGTVRSDGVPSRARAVRHAGRRERQRPGDRRRDDVAAALRPGLLLRRRPLPNAVHGVGPVPRSGVQPSSAGQRRAEASRGVAAAGAGPSTRRQPCAPGSSTPSCLARQRPMPRRAARRSHWPAAPRTPFGRPAGCCGAGPARPCWPPWRRSGSSSPAFCTAPRPARPSPPSPRSGRRISPASDRPKRHDRISQAARLVRRPVGREDPCIPREKDPPCDASPFWLSHCLPALRLGGGIARANVCQAGPLMCSTAMPVGGYCECTARGATESGEVVTRAQSRPANAKAGGCGAQPNAPGCR